MKKIAKILFWSVLFVWMIFLQPQNVMAAEADEIIKELDFTDINAQTQDLPEKMDFEKMVNKLVTEGTGGLDAGMICEYIADLFFYEITAAKPKFLQMFAIGSFICAVRKSDDDATGVCFADELFYCLSWGGSVVAAIICPDLRGGRSGD